MEIIDKRVKNGVKFVELNIGSIFKLIEPEEEDYIYMKTVNSHLNYSNEIMNVICLNDGEHWYIDEEAIVERLNDVELIIK